MRIVELEGTRAIVDAGGVRKSARMDLLPRARVGDWVLIHAGLAISIVDEEEAKETLALLERFGLE